MNNTSPKHPGHTPSTADGQMDTIRLSFESEITEIRRILATIPPESVIDRCSFEDRLASVETAFAKYLARAHELG